YAGDKKLCGILIENAIAGTKIQHIFVGIGMNVNERNFSPDLPNPVSLYQITGQEHDLYQMASLIRHHVMEMVDIPDLYWKEDFDDHLYGLHQAFEFNHEGKMIRGTVEGVDEQGRLVLGLGDQKGLFYAHEIKWQVA
ncbi:MAG TPA: hypothetical protein VJ508_14985, partial [Saprospiraceae bacterium]|nr:hypothetical protein [Saprospiraceae bacterium]